MEVSFERLALWLVVVVCVVLLRILIRLALRSRRGALPPSPGPVLRPPAPAQRQQLPAQPPSPPPPPSAPLPPGVFFELSGLTGEYAGQRFQPRSSELILGRDAAVSHLVFSQDAAGVSKRHCRVFANGSGQVFLEDSWSSNGTFFAVLRPGARAVTTRLEPGAPRELKPGDAFCLGGPQQMFRLDRLA
ncbi:MAG: FHA domain-containing protein [Bryobacterales bacterium]|nr:FHA domain-containing protein [Bryobacterales bacterium]